jgi:predicted metalloprotease with PDZ domain
MGTGFIPYPPAEEDWEVSIHWVIPEAAASSTYVASSLGDVQDSSNIGAPSRVLEKAYFAAGPLHRWPSWGYNETTAGNSDIQAEQDFAMYWIGSLPYNSERVAAAAKRIAFAISWFFGDQSPFRVFWRHVPVGYGGAGGYQSFLFEYSNGTEQEQSEDALLNLLSHETIHNFALMYPTGRQYDLWYREGVAQYYAVVAPYYGNATDKQGLIRWLNNNAQAYYTGGTVGLTWDYIVDHYWTGVDIVKSPYNRGFIYLAQVQGLISSKTNGKKDLDDIVLELYRRFLSRQKCQTEDFVELLGDIIGKEEAEASFEAMKNAALIIPSTDCFAKFGIKMVRRDAERLELGFNPSSLGINKIFGLIKGSRAEQAGVREGDQLISSWSTWGAGDSLDNMMQLVILRDGQQLVIKYWPRSYDKVENWMWVEEEA